MLLLRHQEQENKALPVQGARLETPDLPHKHPPREHRINAWRRTAVLPFKLKDSNVEYLLVTWASARIAT